MDSSNCRVDKSTRPTIRSYGTQRQNEQNQYQEPAGSPSRTAGPKAPAEGQGKIPEGGLEEKDFEGWQALWAAFNQRQSTRRSKYSGL